MLIQSLLSLLVWFGLGTHRAVEMKTRGSDCVSRVVLCGSTALNFNSNASDRNVTITDETSPTKTSHNFSSRL